MKLYNLPRGSLFRLKEDPKVPPDGLKPFLDVKYKLHTIDGMYSYVTDLEHNVYHFAAWTEVEPVVYTPSRIDIIGQNGNDGDHYEEVLS